MKNSRVDVGLQSEQVSKAALWTLIHKFREVYRLQRREVYGFIEGYGDRGLYQTYIDRKVERKGYAFRSWVVEGKPNMAEVFNLLKGGIRDERQVLFFMDKDFVPYVEDSVHNSISSHRNVYVTKGHSVENELITRRIFGEILQQVLGLGGLQGQDFDEALDCFEQALGVFYSHMVEVSATLIVGCLEGKKPMFDRVNMGDMFKFANKQLVLKPAVSEEGGLARYACQRIGLEYDSHKDGIADWVARLGDEPPQAWVHGKSALWFLVRYARHMREEYKASSEAKGGTEQPFSEGNALSVLGPRATPRSLRKFVSRTAMKFIAEVLDG